jgi:hypothetical protein
MGFGGHETALGKVEAQVCSEKGCFRQAEGPSRDERCGQEEVVGPDESSLGREAKSESLTVVVRRFAYSRLPYHDGELFETRRVMLEDDLSHSIPSSSGISKRWRWQGIIV